MFVEDGEATLTLDASASRVFNRQHISRYVWRLVSSRPPVADAGSDQTVSTPTVTLDASGSQAADERPIVKYIWRRIEPHEESEERRDEKPMATPFLKAIRPNTVSALNAVTISDEVLGSSDGNPDQIFSLTHAPVHADGAQIAVREPDDPPKDELRQLEKELRQTDKEAQALLSPPEAIAAWVRWHQVSDFYDSEPHSRHFVLHPADGQIRFGDGQRGMIPPVGHNNIKAVLYRTHDGAAGNVGAGAITVLRNPSDDLADIRTVTNPEAAAGGSDAETVDEVKQRGPWVLKHRHQAVTHRGFEWLAREASSEVARAYCLSARNPKGLPEPGWVTVVIIPESTAAKPTPNPALVRRVKEYLRDLALTNLTTGVNRIYVKGPEYIEARVRARIVPWNPAKADEVEFAVLERLDTFLHPLQGGSKGEGWELGRDVYPSEVYAEIEAVPGVDHVVHVRFLGSMRQQRLYLKKEDYRAPFDLPTDSQVSTFDERIKLLLTKPVFKGQELTSFPVYDFKVDDKVTIVAADNRVLVDDLSIALLSADSITFAAPFDPPADLTQCDALLSSDGRLRLPLAEDGISVDAAGKVVAVTVRGLKAGDQVSVVSYGQRDPRLELLPVEKVEFCEDRIFVPEGHLIYPGSHELEMALE